MSQFDGIKHIYEKIKKATDVPAYLLGQSSSSMYSGERIQTGIYKIDFLLEGGFPCGRMIELFGGESSGKTTTALSLIAKAQKTYPGKVIVIYIDSENALDLSYMKRIGVDIENIIIQQPDFGEQALNLVKVACEQKIDDKLLDDHKMIIVIDSVAALVPKCEFEEDDISKSGGVGRQAAMMSSSIRQLVTPVNNAKACALFINQIRDNIMSWGPAPTPGGRALKFYCSIRIQTSKTGKWGTAGTEDSGIITKMTVVKSKMFSPFKCVEFHIGPNGIDVWRDLFEDAVKLKILNKEKNTYFYNEAKLGPSQNASVESLRNNKEVALDILKKIYAQKDKIFKSSTDPKPAQTPESTIEEDKEIMSS